MTDDRMMEIFTRAVAGRTKRRMTWVHTFAAEGVKHVLGVHLGKTIISVRETDGKLSTSVTVHCDLWCRDAKETLVLQTTAESVFDVDVPNSIQIDGEREITASLADSPRSTGIKIDGDKVMLTLEVDVAIEVIGHVRIWVRHADLVGTMEPVPQPQQTAQTDAPPEPESMPPAPPDNAPKERNRHKSRLN